MPLSFAVAILSSQLILVGDRVTNLDEQPICSDQGCLAPQQTPSETLIEAWPQFAKIGSGARGETSSVALRIRPSPVADPVPYLNYGPTCRESTIRNCGDLQTETCKFFLETCNQNEELACKVLVKCWPNLTSLEKARCAEEARYAGMPQEIASYTVWLSCIQINYNARNSSQSGTFTRECSFDASALQGVTCPASGSTPSDARAQQGSARSVARDRHPRAARKDGAALRRSLGVD
jgi:hypothetical protein